MPNRHYHPHLLQSLYALTDTLHIRRERYNLHAFLIQPILPVNVFEGLNSFDRPGHLEKRLVVGTLLGWVEEGAFGVIAQYVCLIGSRASLQKGKQLIYVNGVSVKAWPIGHN
jgi:hypothetical protein